MKEYLGIVPPNDAQGVLQDVHWSYGSIGYFSTYALGNLISVQLWEKMRKDIGDLEAHVRDGEFRGPALAGSAKTYTDTAASTILKIWCCG